MGYWHDTHLSRKSGRENFSRAVYMIFQGWKGICAWVCNDPRFKSNFFQLQSFHFIYMLLMFHFPPIRSIKTCFTAELRKVFLDECSLFWPLTHKFASPQQTEKWVFKSVLSPPLKPLKVVFVRAYSKNVWLNSWLRLRPCPSLPFLALVYVWPRQRLCIHREAFMKFYIGFSQVALFNLLCPQRDRACPIIRSVHIRWWHNAF